MNGFEKTQDGISPVLEKLLGKAQDASGAFARVYPLYQRLQVERFETEGSSQGTAWPPLNVEYARYKPRRYGGGERRKSKTRPAGRWQSFPGGGRKMLIGTSTLAGAVIGPGEHPFLGTDHHRALFQAKSMTISVATGGTNAEGAQFEYPSDVNEIRPFFSFSDSSIQEFKSEVSKFLVEKE